MYLEANHFVGGVSSDEIPNSLSQLDLSYNQLSGTFPFSEGNFSLNNIYIRGNYFSGSLPFDLSTLAQVRNLDIGNNLYTGPLTRVFHTVSFVFVLSSIA